MYSILFVCTGNQFRSPIAAEVFRQQLVLDGQSTKWQVKSAGTWTTTGRRVPPEAVQLAQSFGVNIEDQTTLALDKSLLEEADVILVMETGHKESIQVEFPFARNKVYLLSQVVAGVAYDIPDPASSNGEAHQIIGELVEMVHGGANKIYQLVEK
jgi:protein-tyrosine phosphatase